MQKKVLFFLPTILVVNVFLLSSLLHPTKLALIGAINKKDITTSTTKKVEIDETVHKKLSIDSLYVKDNKDGESNKVDWYYSKSNKTYYLLLPKLIDRNNVTISFDCGVNTYLSIYDKDNNYVDKVVNNGVTALTLDEYIFKLETNVEKVTEYKVKVKQSELPSLYITLDNGTKGFNKINGDINHEKEDSGKAVFADQNNSKFEVVMKSMKGRGNASWEREKKGYILKFDEKISPYGMKEAKKFVLLANYPDGSLSRNYLFYHFAQDLGLEYSVESNPVELYVNGRYHGSYLIATKIDVKKGSVDIDESNYILEIEKHPDTDIVRVSRGNAITIHNPDITKMEAADKKQTQSEVKKYVDKIENLIYKDTSYEEITKYIDLESFAKFYWVQDISVNFDAERGSNYVYVKDGILYAGPVWDCDNTMNRSYTYAPVTGYYVLDNARLQMRINENWYRGLMKKKYFSDLVDDVYFRYKDVIDSLPTKLMEYNDYIGTSAEMNYIRWPYKVMMSKQEKHPWISGNNNYESALKQFNNMLSTRINWYNSQYNKVEMDSFSYKVVRGNNVIVDTTNINNLNNIKLSTSVKLNDEIIVYGTKNGEVKELDKFKLDSETLTKKIEINSKTSSSYKKENTKYYELTFVK